MNKVSIWSWVSIALIIITIIILGVADLDSSFLHLIANQDKYLHVFTFFALVFIVKALFKTLPPFKISLYVFAFSLVIEILQEFLSKGLRHFHLSDVLANTIGIALATFIICLIERRKTSATN